MATKTCSSDTTLSLSLDTKSSTCGKSHKLINCTLKQNKKYCFTKMPKQCLIEYENTDNIISQQKHKCENVS